MDNDCNAVNHPSHYCRGGMECIDVMRAFMSAEQFSGYCRGNVIKYTLRYDQKNGIQDLKKAKVYLNWLIEALE